MPGWRWNAPSAWWASVRRDSEWELLALEISLRNTDEDIHNPAATSYRRRVVAEQAVSGDSMAKPPGLVTRSSGRDMRATIRH